MSYLNIIGSEIKADDVIIKLGASDLESLARQLLSYQIGGDDTVYAIVNLDIDYSVNIEINGEDHAIQKLIETAGYVPDDVSGNTYIIMTLLFNTPEVRYTWRFEGSDRVIDIRVPFAEYIRFSLQL